jgi:hypothetical protein
MLGLELTKDWNHYGYVKPMDIYLVYRVCLIVMEVY